MSQINLNKVRRQTPACQELLHFNNAGASLMPAPVYDTLTDYLALEQRVGPYEAWEQRQDDFQAFYATFARLLNAKPSEIAYAENASRAWALAICAIPFEAGDRILVHETEYASNFLMLLNLVKTKGVVLDVIPSDAAGQIDLEGLRQAIKPQTKALVVTHLSAQGNGLAPAAELGAICREYDLLYVLDASQSVGQMPIDVQQMSCDILVGTGRKFLRGPRGTGFLFISQQIQDSLQPVFVEMHTATWQTPDSYQEKPGAQRFETSERNMAGQLALAAAAEYALDIGLDAIWARIQTLSRDLLLGLDAIAGVNTNQRVGQQSGIVTFSKTGVVPQELVSCLRSKGINTSSLSLQQAKLDFERQGISSLVRSSLHYFNTKAEIDRFCHTIANIQVHP